MKNLYPVIPTGNFIVKRGSLFIRTERPSPNEKFYRGKFVRDMVTATYSIFEREPTASWYADVRVEVWQPVGEITEEIFDGEKCAVSFPETVMTFGL